MKSWLSLLKPLTPYTELPISEREALKSEVRKVCAGYAGIADAPGIMVRRCFMLSRYN
jgi:hypothetical protein